MLKIQTYNNISIKGLEQFSRADYEVASEMGHADAILLRSHKLAAAEITNTVKAIARAGAGVNNIPVDYCSEQGIPVFNTPGANANAVKELVLTALLLASRGIVKGINFVNTQENISDHGAFGKMLEKEKKRFAGQEIQGKVLGVVGLGAIGSKVADMALKLDMQVLGYDPAISVEAAWRLSSKVKKVDNLQSLLAASDYITLHLPAIDATRHTINKDALSSIKPGAKLLNFAREEVVDSEAVIESLNANMLGMYITDFPSPELIGREDTLLMPHIGASTAEAEENCAVMAANQLQDFLKNGNIKNSVNFPPLYLERSAGYRIGFANMNVPKVLSSVLNIFADNNINVIDMLNKSRNDIAYNLIDLDKQPTDKLIQEITSIEGVIKVHTF